MRQRLQIARALAIEPEILLMDEPFAALDALTRRKMHSFLLEIWERTRKTIVFVTHDISESILMADRIVVMTSVRIPASRRCLKVELAAAARSSRACLRRTLRPYRGTA